MSCIYATVVVLSFAFVCPTRLEKTSKVSELLSEQPTVAQHAVLPSQNILWYPVPLNCSELQWIQCQAALVDPLPALQQQCVAALHAEPKAVAKRVRYWPRWRACGWIRCGWSGLPWTARFRCHVTRKWKANLKTTESIINSNIPSGYLTYSHGKSPFLIGKPSISMGHFPWLCLIIPI